MLAWKPKSYKPCFAGTCDYLALSHYTTFFTSQTQKDSPLIMDYGIRIVKKEEYATASSDWLQVKK
jgi:hypothetical protein